MRVDSPAAAGDDKHNGRSRCCPQPFARRRYRPGKNAGAARGCTESGVNTVVKSLGRGKRSDQAQRDIYRDGRFACAGFLRKSIQIWVTHGKTPTGRATNCR